MFILFFTSNLYSAETVKEVFGEKDSWQKLENWSKGIGGYKDGFVKQASDVYFCDNGSNAKGERGVCFRVLLNQKVPEPIQATLWSKAEKVSGSEDSNYSLYIDLVYTDGTSLWGQTKNFSIGSHDWEQKKVFLFPDKPIRSMSFYGLFRGHSGKAWFKDPNLYRLTNSEKIAFFDSTPVFLKNRKAGQANQATASSPKSDRQLQIRDLGRKTDYLLIGSDPLPLKTDLIDLSFKTKVEKSSFGTVLNLEIESKSNDDRILSVVWTKKNYPNEVIWYSDARKSQKTEKSREYREGRKLSVGGSGFLSEYPFGVVSYEKEGKQIASALGIDPEYPCFYRTAYNAAFHEFYIAVDFALTREKRSVKFRLIDFDPSFASTSPNPFRSALDHYYRWFPNAFQQRIKKHGIWMPFHPISKVQGWEDFGFRFKEGDGETGWDDKHDIITFRYTEPGTWWMPLKKGAPRTYQEAFAEAQRLAAKGSRSAQSLLTCGHRNLKGEIGCRLMDTPWCDGAVWSLCDLPGLSPLAQQKKLPYSDQYQVASVDWKWSPALIEKLYSNDPKKPVLDGEYIDSSETYVTDILDYCREHFAGVRTSLVYDSETLRPGIFSGLMAYEYVHQIAKDMHARGKLMMANSTPSRFFWLVPLLDILGTETNWNRNNVWSPMDDSDLLYKRAMCGPKPYCFLMNTNFDQFGYDLSEKFMKRSLAYGHFPGYFSANAATGHYFTRPDLYNRDRPLFKKYVPLCRIVSEAGWQPITRAKSSSDEIFVERFGSDYYTIFNSDKKSKKSFSIIFETKKESVTDLVTGRTFSLNGNVLNAELGPEEVMLLK